jgi:Domain of Unknown Function (DUF928)
MKEGGVEPPTTGNVILCNQAIMQFLKPVTALALLVLADWAIATHPALAAIAFNISANSRQSLYADPTHSTVPSPIPAEEPMEIAIRFRSRQWSSLRRLGAPRWSIGGAARGGCTVQEAPLVPLMPVTNLTDSYPTFSAVTVDEHPSFFAYIPPTTARSVEFLLIDEESGQVAYEPAPLTIDGRAQIVSFHHDATLPPLEVNKTYTWYFSLVCDNDTFNRPDMTDNSSSPYVRGWLQRVAPDQTTSTSLARATARDRPQIYADAGIWLDTLTALASLRCTAPNDATVASDWADLMRSLNLYQIPELSMRIERDTLNTVPLAQCE